MGNKAPTNANEVSKCLSLPEIEAYFKTHKIKPDKSDNPNKLFDIDIILIQCLASDMTLEAFEYLLNKINYIRLNNEYTFIKPYISNSAKSFKVLTRLYPFHLSSFLKYTKDMQLLEDFAMYVITNGLPYQIERVVNNFVTRKKSLAPYYKIILESNNLDKIHLFQQLDPNFKLEDLCTREQLRKIRRLNSEYDSD